MNSLTHVFYRNAIMLLEIPFKQIQAWKEVPYNR